MEIIEMVEDNLFRCDMCHELYSDGKIIVKFNEDDVAKLCYHCGREIQRQMQGKYEMFMDD
jgi:hypothetical protein